MPNRTPTTAATASAMASPVRFMGKPSLQKAGLAAGEEPIDETAGNPGGRKHLALARDIAVRLAHIAGEIEAVAQGKGEHTAERRVEDARTPGKPFRERDDQQRRQEGHDGADGGANTDA